MIARRYIATIAAVLLVGVIAFGQERSSTKSSSSSRDNKAISYKAGNAWTLSYPLGLHYEAQLDTLLYNYQQQSIPSMQYDACATTGNLGTEGINLNFFERESTSNFFFADALDAWIPSFKKRKFYNVYIPTTILSYNTGGNKDSNQDRLRATFAGNVNRRIGIGANFDYLYSKGSYENQAAKDFSVGLSAYYTGDRYEVQAFYDHYNFLNKENGGITNDLYITDPAVLQGGVEKIDPKSIPTKLSAAHTRINGNEFFMNHAYKIGYWREEQVNDTLTRKVYIPVTKVLYTFDYRSGHHMFKNTNSSQEQSYWDNHYFDPSASDDNTRYWQLSNTIGLSMIEGFNKWAKFGLAAYATFETRHYTQASQYYETTDADTSDNSDNESSSLSTLPAGFNCNPSDSQNLFYIGAELTKQQGAILRYNASGRFGIIGDVAGDIELEGNIQTNIPLLGDTVSIAAKGHFKNTEQPYLLQHFISNNFAWDNDFGKTRSLRIGGEILIPRSGTKLRAGVENLQNYVYFGSDCTPKQEGKSIRIFSASLEQNLKFGIWNWNNKITYQTSSQKEALPLPSLIVYSNMFLQFEAFRVLQLQIGVDCDYYTKYTGLAYQPATMSFYTQSETALGNYPFANAYITAKLYKVRFYLMFSHLNQGWFSKEYFSLPGYPLNPRRFQLGLSIDFAD